jgi:hypothetical protein
MAIAFDAATVTTSTTGATHTFSHTCTGTDRFLFVTVEQLNDTTTDKVTGVTYGGVAMTRLSKINVLTYNWVTYVYYLKNPASGANNVVVSRTYAAGQTYGGACSYTGVNQTTPINANTTGTGINGTMTTSLTSTVDNSWFYIGATNIDASFVASTNSTLRGTATSIGCHFDSNGPKTPSGSLSMTQTWTGTRNSVSHMAALSPSVASATTNPAFLYNFV